MIPFLLLPGIRSLILADDDPDDQALIKESMDNGLNTPNVINVISVFDGAELLRTLKKNIVPDLLLMDLNMPGKNGFECLGEIRQLSALRTLPIVVLSTSRQLADIELCYDKGADLFFPKPNSFSELLKLVNAILRIDWNNFPDRMSKKEFVKISSFGFTTVAADA